MVLVPYLGLLIFAGQCYIVIRLYNLGLRDIIALLIINLVLSPFMWALHAFATGLVAFVAL